MQYFNNKMASGRVTAPSPEILHLKSLLQKGDMKAIAEQSGFSSSHIGAVFRGFSHNPDIIRALKKFILENKRTEQKKQKDAQDNTTDRQHTEQLLTANLKTLKRCALFLTRNRVAAEDLLHEAIEVLLTKCPYRYIPGRYRGKYTSQDDPFIAFMYGIMVNLQRNQRLVARKLNYTDQILDCHVLTTANAAESNMMLSIIDEEIAKASPTLKRVLHQLFCYANISTTAQEAGMTIHMLRKYWARVGVPFQEQLQKSLELNPQQFAVRPTL